MPAFAGRGLTLEKMGDLVLARADYRRALSMPATETSELQVAKERLGEIAALEKISAALPTIALTRNKKTIVAPVRRRIALVIGNAEYVHWATLKNPVADARMVVPSSAPVSRLWKGIIFPIPIF